MTPSRLLLGSHCFKNISLEAVQSQVKILILQECPFKNISGCYSGTQVHSEMQLFVEKWWQYQTRKLNSRSYNNLIIINVVLIILTSPLLNKYHNDSISEFNINKRFFHLHAGLPEKNWQDRINIEHHFTLEWHLSFWCPLH